MKREKEVEGYLAISTAAFTCFAPQANMEIGQYGAPSELTVLILLERRRKKKQSEPDSAKDCKRYITRSRPYYIHISLTHLVP